MEDKLKKRFETYHREHPYIYQVFDEIACNMISLGRKHGRAKEIGELMRNKSNAAWKEFPNANANLDNTFLSFYARLWTSNNPSREGFFTIRKRPIEKELEEPQVLYIYPAGRYMSREG